MAAYVEVYLLKESGSGSHLQGKKREDSEESSPPGTVILDFQPLEL